MSGNLDNFCGTEFWNSNLTWYTSDPELTPCFKQTILVWLPLAFLWLFSPVDLYCTLTSKSRHIPWNWKNITKFIVICCLIIINIFEFIFVLVKRGDKDVIVHDVSILAPVIRFITMASCLIFLLLHKRYGQISSGLICTFWFILSIVGIPQFRTDLYSYQNHNSDMPELKVSYMLFYCLCTVMFLLNILPDDSPTISKYTSTKNACPELKASFPSRVTFAWFDKLALLGYRKPLVASDLWELNPTERSQVVLPQFHRHSKQFNGGFDGKSEEVKFSQSKSQARVSVIKPLFKCFGLTFTAGAVMQLVQDIFAFVSPQILKLLIEFVEVPGQPVWRGYLYVIVLVGASVFQTLLTSQCQQKMFLVGLHARTCLISAIYTKALRVSNESRKESTVGEIVNLMSVDAQRVMDIMPYVNTIWSGPVQIALAIYFLWQVLGVSSMAGLGLMILLIPMNGLVAGKMKTLQMKQMKNKDERVKTMNEILSGIKVLKLYGWEGSFEEQVQKIRTKEMKVLQQSAYLNAAISFVWACAPQLVALSSFACFVLIDSNNVLDAKTAFVSLSLFNILRMPLTILPFVIMIAVQTVVSLNRITKFLNLEELDPCTVTHHSNQEDPVVIENGEFTWDSEKSFVLRNIDLNVEKGKLIAVVGQVGCGKTSLLSAILGEMNKLSGYVNTKGSIAYVPQQAWIRNATLRDNIVFGKTFKQKNYSQVIESCALLPDIEMLPGGDKTEIGEKGINLSGGQKQRVSLARAVYFDSDIYLLDDPLSAVDSHVGKHIFEQVIGPQGLLSKKTRILVTHSITHLPETDVIVVMKDNTISEMGSYKQLLDKRAEFSDFIISHIQESAQDIEQQELEEIAKTLIDSNPELEKKLIKTKSRKSITSDSSKHFDRQGSTVSQTSESSVGSGKRDPVVGEKLIDKEKAETGGVKWSVYLYYIRSVGLVLSVTSLLLNTCVTGVSIGTNVWLSRWSNDRSNSTSTRDMYLSGYGALAAVQIVVVMALAVSIYLGALRAAHILHNGLLYTILRVPMSFFDVTPLGRIINRFSTDVNTLDNTLPHTIRSAIGCAFQVVGTLVVISYSTPIFVAVVVPIGLIYYFIQRFYVATSRQLMRLESVSRSPIYSHFSETVTGSSSIRAFNLESEFTLESQEKVDLNQVCYYPSLIAARWLAVRLEMVGTLIVFFSSLFAVLARDWISAGIVGLSVSYALQITESLNWGVQMATAVENNIVSVERIQEYSQTPQEAPWEIESSRVGPQWPSVGKIEFKNFSVRYRPGLDLILKSVSFVVNGGEKVGIVGRTGAGKSSLTLSLFRILEPSGGNIYIDDIDISVLGLHQLRSSLSIIPQDPVLFSGSLRMNLDPFNKHTDDEVWKSLELSHLKNYVKSLPAALQHEVTEGGDNLSVGQRQLICLARALLRKAQILVLDEATAAVDLETDDLIQKTIRSEFRTSTVLTIAHRINTIMDSDRVLVLDKGIVAEYDSPARLLQSSKSIFYSMARDAGLA